MDMNMDEPDAKLCPGKDLQAPKTFSRPLVGVLVVYTDAAAELIKKDKPAGLDSIVLDAQARVDAANRSYRNSHITQRLYLAHAFQTAYQESGSAVTDLSRMENPNDGHLDNIASMRERYGADMVTLIPATLDTGLANFAINEASRAFTVICWFCTGSTLAHELGHLQGCGHANEVNPYWAYGRGFYRTGQYRTVMANECGLAGETCNQILYWANPSIVREGLPMGVPNVHDDVRLMNERGPVMAKLVTAKKVRLTGQIKLSPSSAKLLKGYVSVLDANTHGTYPDAQYVGGDVYWTALVNGELTFSVEVAAGHWKLQATVLADTCKIKTQEVMVHADGEGQSVEVVINVSP